LCKEHTIMDNIRTEERRKELEIFSIEEKRKEFKLQ
jgi:hypothetical protein